MISFLWLVLYNFYTVYRKRYGNVEPEALEAILCPILISIIELDKNVVKLPGQTHCRGSFSIAFNDLSKHLMQRGMTGKFIPANYLEGGAWKEKCKGRLIDIDLQNSISYGEVYGGSKKRRI